jgi:hypothetical protein
VADGGAQLRGGCAGRDAGGDAAPVAGRARGDLTVELRNDCGGQPLPLGVGAGIG